MFAEPPERIFTGGFFYTTMQEGERMFAKRLVTVVSVVLLLGMALGGCGGMGDGATVKVSPSGTISYLTSIQVTPTNPSIAVGTSQQFTVTGIYSDNSTQDVTASTLWVSSDEAKVSMSSSGLASAVGVGSAVITARIGGVSNTNTVTVTGAALVSIAVTPTNPSIAKGTSQQFTATGTFSDNSTQDLSSTVTWSSSSSSVATISNATGSQGRAAAVAAGSTTITAASGSIKGTTTLSVTPATLLSIAVTPTNPSIALGTTQQLTATGTYSDGTTQNLTTTATWSSSNTAVATVNNTGLATSVATGPAVISAQSGGITGQSNLTVTPATLESIAVSPTNPSIALGTTRQFTATGTYSDGSTQNLTNTVTWSSTTTGVATVSNATGSKGLATSVAVGTTTIAAASGSVSKSTTLTITPATLVSLAVTPASASIVKGGSQQYTATGTYSDASTQNLTSAVTWSSSNTSVATISNASGSNGRATGVNTGSATMTAVSGGVSKTATLTVTSNTATLTWNAPTQYADGSALNPATDLQSYKIYYGTASRTYTQTMSVANPGSASVSQTVTLTPGSYFFVVTAITTGGQESDYSNEVMKSL